MLLDKRIASRAFFFISIISVGTIAFILAFLCSPKMSDNSPKISPDSIFPTFFPSISTFKAPDIIKKAVLPLSPCLKTYSSGNILFLLRAIFYLLVAT